MSDSSTSNPNVRRIITVPRCTYCLNRPCIIMVALLVELAGCMMPKAIPPDAQGITFQRCKVNTFQSDSSIESACAKASNFWSQYGIRISFGPIMVHPMDSLLGFDYPSGDFTDANAMMGTRSVVYFVRSVSWEGAQKGGIAWTAGPVAVRDNSNASGLVLAHEIGHALSLTHTSEFGNLMEPTVGLFPYLNGAQVQQVKKYLAKKEGE